MKNLVLFGDSLFANISKHRQIWLEEKLPSYNVYNCAAGGWDSNDCVLKGPYLSTLKPDVLMLSLGTNDACPWKQVDLRTFRQNLIRIFSLFPDSKLIYFLPPPINEEILSKDSKRHVLNNVIMKQYHDAAKKVCLQHTISYLDSWSSIKPILDKQDNFHTEDGIHITDEGYNLLLSLLADLVQ